MKSCCFNSDSLRGGRLVVQCIFHAGMILLLLLVGVAPVWAKTAATSTANVDSAHYLSKVNRPVFYARVFGKDFPIPARFEYEKPSSPEADAIFKSPNGVLLRENMPSIGPGDIRPPLERIQLGSYSALIKAFKKHPLPGTYKMKKYKCYGLDVEAIHPLTGLMKRAGRILIVLHDKEEYLSFMVKSDDVVSQLLALYGAENGVASGSDCKLGAK